MEQLQTQVAPGGVKPASLAQSYPGDDEAAARSKAQPLKRCFCPMCRSGDVWRWGKPGWFTSKMEKMFSLSQLTCRRCGYKFLKRRVTINGEE